jgi:hypothetical protein
MSVWGCMQHVGLAPVATACTFMAPTLANLHRIVLYVVLHKGLTCLGTCEQHVH